MSVFSSSIRNSRGLSDFQIEYIDQHTGEKAKVGPKMLIATFLISLLTAMTAASLWTQSFYPELLPEQVVNFTGFSVVVVTIMQIALGFLLMLVMVLMGGVNLFVAGITGIARAADAQEGQDFADVIDAKTMMSNRNQFRSYTKTPADRLKSLVRTIISYSFVGGMIATGYVFAPVCLIIVFIFVAVFMARGRAKIVKHTKTLDPARVTYLEDVYRRDEAKQREEDGVVTIEATAVVSEPSPGPGVYIYTAMDTTGQEINDEIEAISEADAQAKIRQQGYFVTEIRRR